MDFRKKRRQVWDMTVEERFWHKVDKTDDCWLWMANKNRKGYGRFSIGKGKQVKAHRYSWRLHFGPIPRGYFVCHHCDNPSCVNPAHLFLGTPKDNIRDMWRKGRWRPGGTQGEGVCTSKLTAQQVRKIRKIFDQEDITYSELGRRYGVGHSTISKIVNGQSWKHLLPD